ncbi:hypothetical protein MAR_006291 [Mya arenaria]|uniref:Uncharacterized protein n=1 Tax=Mya arenaria TaxID=6604 RepID=A0ABY7DBT2_MYAAR|nr:hypothetical protein MAR_006291 [Mya arenaria]
MYSFKENQRPNTVMGNVFEKIKGNEKGKGETQDQPTTDKPDQCELVRPILLDLLHGVWRPANQQIAPITKTSRVEQKVNTFKSSCGIDNTVQRNYNTNGLVENKNLTMSIFTLTIREGSQDSSCMKLNSQFCRSTLFVTRSNVKCGSTPK